MVKATAKMADGRVLIVMGISEGNVDRLKKGDPIYFRSRGPTHRTGDDDRRHHVVLRGGRG